MATRIDASGGSGSEAPLARARRRARFRVAVEFAAARLARRPGSRAGLALALALAGAGALATAALRLGGGEDLGASVAGWIAEGSLWLAGLPVALSAAGDGLRRDAEEGIVTLTAARGLGLRSLELARTLAAIRLVSVRVALAPIVASLTWLLSTFALAGAARALAASLLFAVAAGVTFGGLGAACARLGRPRGRTLLLVALFVPWLLASLAGRASFSLPGALSALASLAFGMEV